MKPCTVDLLGNGAAIYFPYDYNLRKTRYIQLQNYV